MYQVTQTKAAGRCRQLALDLNDPVGKTLLLGLAERLERRACPEKDKSRDQK